MEVMHHVLFLAQENGLVISWLQQDNMAVICYYLEQLDGLLEGKEPDRLKNCLNVLIASLCCPALRHKMASKNWHLQVYSSIKNSACSADNVSLAVEFIKRIVLNNEVLELQLA